MRVKIKQFNNIQIPEFKLRSEFEMEKILNRHKILARKRQIELVRLDSEIPLHPLGLSTYMHKESRKKLLQVVGMYLRLFLP